MLFSPSTVKADPFIKQLREELEIRPKTRQNPYENYWFCLKPAEKLEYMIKNKIYCVGNQEKASESAISVKGFARKTGKCVKNAKDDDVCKEIPRKHGGKSRKIRKTRHFVPKTQKIHVFKEKHAESKQIVIEIEDD